MFKRKDIKVTIITRCKNEDNFKVIRLCDTYKKSGTMIDVISINKNGEDKVTVKFTTKEFCIKNLTEHINLLNYVGIVGKMTIEK